MYNGGVCLIIEPWVHMLALPTKPAERVCINKILPGKGSTRCRGEGLLKFWAIQMPELDCW